MTFDKSNSNQIIYPWATYRACSETIPLIMAAGRIAASTIRQYPPGIPDVIPGMEYAPQTVDLLNSAIKSDAHIIGINMSPEPKVEVVSEKKSRNDQLQIFTFQSQQTPDSTANEIADFFRLSFSEAPYFHFAFHESDPLKPLPYNLNFAAYAVSVSLSDDKKRRDCQDTLVDLAVRSAILEKTKSNIESIVLPKGFHHWTDKAICRDRIKDRLADPGYITLVRDKTTHQLKGLLHARMGTVERLFYSEEWSNPHIFSSFNDPNFEDDADRFFEKIYYHFNLIPSDPVMTISAQVLSPDIQGGEIFYEMMRSMALKISPKHSRLPLLCEIPSHGTAHTLNTAFTNRIIFGILDNSHPLVFCEQTSQALFPFISEKKHWHTALRSAVKDKRDYRTHYFIPLSTDNENLKVRPNGKLGLAVFATSDIAAGSRIAVFTGETYQAQTALSLPSIMRDHAIQISADEYVFGHKGLAHRLCHSCHPNCGIRGLTEIYAIRDISKGDQVTWDYRCSENSNWVLETCLCESERCTGLVGNHDSLPDDFKAEYLSKGMVSDWLTRA